MRVFVYEFMVSGGSLAQDEPFPSSLRVEGEAMLSAVAADFAMLADVELWTLRDGRLPVLGRSPCRVFTANSTADELALFSDLAADADWSLIIAPETGGELLRRTQLAEARASRLLSPSSSCIELAGDKQLTAEHLAGQGVNVPRGQRLDVPARPGDTQLSFPLIAKPVDGCGSQGICLIPGPEALAALPTAGIRLEPYIPGKPASVAVLCGPAGDFALPACQQRLSSEGEFRYLGGCLPLAQPLNERAQRLALQAVATLPGRQGYLGIDLVLGSARDGRDDYVIEINPRLTTSYVGLREASEHNLARALLDVCAGKEPSLSFRPEALEFDADGAVRVKNNTERAAPRE